MAEFFDYDPLTGMTYTTEYNENDDTTTVHSSQDLQAVVDYATRVRNNNDNSGIKEEWWRYCIIPTHVELALRDKGIHIHNKNHQKAMFREINQNYPYLKLTNLHHE